MFDINPFPKKPHEEKSSFLQKFACFMGKRVLTPTFGEKLQKPLKKQLSYLNNESSNQESTLDTCDISAFKKDPKLLQASKHPKISRKSPLFAKFNTRLKEETQDFQKIIQYNDNFFNKTPETIINKDKIIYRKRQFSAKKPREPNVIMENNPRLMTPQIKSTKKEVMNGNYLLDMRKIDKKSEIPKGLDEIIEKLEKVRNY